MLSPTTKWWLKSQNHQKSVSPKSCARLPCSILRKGLNVQSIARFFVKQILNGCGWRWGTPWYTPKWQVHSDNDDWPFDLGVPCLSQIQITKLGCNCQSWIVRSWGNPWKSQAQQRPEGSLSDLPLPRRKSQDPSQPRSTLMDNRGIMKLAAKAPWHWKEGWAHNEKRTCKCMFVHVCTRSYYSDLAEARKGKYINSQGKGTPGTAHSSFFCFQTWTCSKLGSNI
jgi:hypothetical protein